MDKQQRQIIGALALGALTGGLGTVAMGGAFSAGASAGLLQGLFSSIAIALTPEEEIKQKTNFNEALRTALVEGSLQPVLYGSAKMTGVILGKEVYKNEDGKSDDLHVKALLANHYLSSVDLSSFRINNFPLSNDYVNNNIYVRYGRGIQNDFGVFSDELTTQDLSNTEISNTDWLVITPSTTTFDDLELWINFPNGIYGNSGQGSATFQFYVAYERSDNPGVWNQIDTGEIRKKELSNYTLKYNLQSLFQNGIGGNPNFVFDTLNYTYNIRIKRVDVPVENSTSQNKSYAFALLENTITNAEHPFKSYLVYENINSSKFQGNTALSFSINGSRGNFNVFKDLGVNSYLHGKTSENPAYAILDVLTNTKYGGSENINRIDLTSLEAFANDCSTNSYTINTYINSVNEETAWLVAAKIATEFGSSLYDDGEKIYVKMLKQENPVNLFNEANILVNSLKFNSIDDSKLFKNMIVTYKDNTDNDKQKKLWLGQDDPNRGITKDITFAYNTNLDSIKKVCNEMLNLNIYADQLKEISFLTPEALNIEIGDVIYVLHNQFMSDTTESVRIKSVTTLSPGNYRLHFYSPIQNAQTGYILRQNANYEALIIGSTSLLANATYIDLALATAPTGDEVITFTNTTNALNFHTYRVFSMDLNDDLTVMVRALSYREAVYTNELPSIVIEEEAPIDFTTLKFQVNFNNELVQTDGKRAFALNWVNNDKRVEYRNLYMKKGFYNTTTLEWEYEPTWNFLKAVYGQQTDIALPQEDYVRYLFSIPGVYNGRNQDIDLAPQSYIYNEPNSVPDAPVFGTLSLDYVNGSISIEYNPPVAKNVEFIEFRISDTNDETGWENGLIISNLKAEQIGANLKLYLNQYDYAGKYITAKSKAKNGLFSDLTSYLLSSELFYTFYGDLSVNMAFINDDIKLAFNASNAGFVKSYIFAIKSTDDVFEKEIIIDTKNYEALILSTDLSNLKNSYKLVLKDVEFVNYHVRTLNITATTITNTAPSVTSVTATPAFGVIKYIIAFDSYVEGMLIFSNSNNGGIEIPQTRYLVKGNFAEVTIPATSGKNTRLTINPFDYYTFIPNTYNSSYFVALSLPNESINFDLPIKSGFNFQLSGLNFSSGAGQIIAKNVVYDIPNLAFTITSGTTYYVYWVEGTSLLQYTTVEADVVGNDRFIVADIENNVMLEREFVKIITAAYIKTNAIASKVILTKELTAEEAIFVGADKRTIESALVEKIDGSDLTDYYALQKCVINEFKTNKEPYYTGTKTSTSYGYDYATGLSVVKCPAKKGVWIGESQTNAHPLVVSRLQSGLMLTANTQTLYEDDLGQNGYKYYSKFKKTNAAGTTSGVNITASIRTHHGVFLKGDDSSVGQTITLTVGVTSVNYVLTREWQYCTVAGVTGAGSLLIINTSLPINSTFYACCAMAYTPTLFDGSVMPFVEGGVTYNAGAMQIKTDTMNKSEGIIKIRFTPDFIYNHSNFGNYILDTRKTGGITNRGFTIEYSTLADKFLFTAILSSTTQLFSVQYTNDTMLKQEQIIYVKYKDGEKVEFWLNGVLVGLSSANYSSTSFWNDIITIGNRYAFSSSQRANSYFNSIEFYNVAYDSNWIKNDYAKRDIGVIEKNSINYQGIRIANDGFDLVSRDGKSRLTSTQLSFESATGKSSYGAGGFNINSGDEKLVVTESSLSMKTTDPSGNNIEISTENGVLIGDIAASEAVKSNIENDNIVALIPFHRETIVEEIEGINPITSLGTDVETLETDDGTLFGADCIVSKDSINGGIAVSKATTNLMSLARAKFTDGWNNWTASGYAGLIVEKYTSGGINDLPYIRLEKRDSSIYNEYWYADGTVASKCFSIKIKAANASAIGKTMRISLAPETKYITITENWEIYFIIGSSTSAQVNICLTGTEATIEAGDAVYCCMPQIESSTYPTPFALPNWNLLSYTMSNGNGNVSNCSKIEYTSGGYRNFPYTRVTLSTTATGNVTFQTQTVSGQQHTHQIRIRGVGASISKRIQYMYNAYSGDSIYITLTSDWTYIPYTFTATNVSSYLVLYLYRAGIVTDLVAGESIEVCMVQTALGATKLPFRFGGVSRERGVLLYPSNLFNPSQGSIIIKFKPFFDYNSSSAFVLLQIGENSDVTYNFHLAYSGTTKRYYYYYQHTGFALVTAYFGQTFASNAELHTDALFVLTYTATSFSIYLNGILMVTIDTTGKPFSNILNKRAYHYFGNYYNASYPSDCVFKEFRTENIALTEEQVKNLYSKNNYTVGTSGYSAAGTIINKYGVITKSKNGAIELNNILAQLIIRDDNQNEVVKLGKDAVSTGVTGLLIKQGAIDLTNGNKRVLVDPNNYVKIYDTSTSEVYFQVNTTFGGLISNIAILSNVGDRANMYLNNNANSIYTLYVRNDDTTNPRAILATGNSLFQSSKTPALTCRYLGTYYDEVALKVDGILEIGAYSTHAPIKFTAGIPTKAEFETNAETGSFAIVNDGGTYKVGYCVTASTTFKYSTMA